MEDAQKLLKIPKSECPDVWIRLPRHKWPKSWANMEVPVVLLERNLYGHPLVGFLWERQFEEVQLEREWEKYRIGSVYLFIENKDCSCRYAWMISKWLERKNLMKNVDLGNTTSFLDPVYLGRTQRECKPNEIMIEQFKEMFESRISAGQLNSYQVVKNLTQKPFRGPTTWKDMLKNALRDTATWRTKRQSSCTKFQVLAWMIISSRRSSLNQLENYEKYAHKLY